MTIGRFSRPDGLAGLVDVEFHAVEFEQKVVGKLDIGLVDLVDEQHRPLARAAKASHNLPRLM